MIEASFTEYSLSNEIIESIGLLGYNSPTNVQSKVIPIVLNKKDIVVKSQTGSGKTAAFAIPICQMVDWDENKPQALVVAPTRELSIQIREDFFNIGRFKRLKVAAIFGKAPFVHQAKELKQKTHVVVGTPGRIIDHLERGTLDTSQIKYLVIDEADELMNMGFIEQLEAIIDRLPDERVTMLFSATLPTDIDNLCNKYMKLPQYVEIENQSKTVERISQERYNVEEEEKAELLRDITVIENPDSCIIFCSTKQKVDEVFQELSRCKYPCDKIHGGMEQVDRLRIMNDFKMGAFRYLIATDVAARGIDVDNISLVINYDISRDKEGYVHRIGRTGRVNKTGKAITFVTPVESKRLGDIEEYIGVEIPVHERPDKERVQEKENEFVEKISVAPEIKEAKGSKLSEGIMKLHINAGRKTKMRAVDIVGTLCNINGMTAEDIGIINILDVSTFVEILNDKGEMVFKVLQKTPIKGRLRTVSKADR